MTFLGEMQASSLKRKTYDNSYVELLRSCWSAFIIELSVPTTSFRTPLLQTHYLPYFRLQIPIQDYITMRSSAILVTIFAAIVGTTSGKNYKRSRASKAMKLCICTHRHAAGQPSSCLYKRPVLSCLVPEIGKQYIVYLLVAGRWNIYVQWNRVDSMAMAPLCEILSPLRSTNVNH